MANLKEFNFRHQTAALSSPEPPKRASSGNGGRGGNLRGGGRTARQVAEDFQAEQPIDSRGDAC